MLIGTFIIIKLCDISEKNETTRARARCLVQGSLVTIRRLLQFQPSNPHPDSRKEQGKKAPVNGIGPLLKYLSEKFIHELALRSHWPDCSHTTTCMCRGGWEIFGARHMLLLLA